ncbi:hypothetical protein NMG60_11029549 [Bertholletia excelsa]
MNNQSFSDEVCSPAQDSEIQSEIFVEFSLLIEKLTIILEELKHNKLMDTPQIKKAVESLETELRRAKALVKNPNYIGSPLNKKIEDVTHDLGRSLGLVLFASYDVPMESKEKIDALRKEMMSVKFTSTPESELINDAATEETGETGETGEEEIEEEIVEEIEEDGEITLDVDDIVLQLKYGNDDEFKCALSGLSSLIGDEALTSEWVDEEGVIQILFNRLGSSKPHNRLTIIQILRGLASQRAENK